MPRNRTIQACLLLVLVLPAVLAPRGDARAATAAAATRPNIVFILADDIRADDVLAMPRTRALVGDAGVTLDKVFADVSMCCPSRATTLTGQYPQNTHVYANSGEEGGYETFRAYGNGRATIGTMLRRAGYRTAMLGKFLNDYPLPGQTDLVPPGWDVWGALAHDYYDQYDYDIVNTDGSTTHYGTAEADYAGDVLRDRALAFIDHSARGQRPFMLYLAFVSPHNPATAARRHSALYRDAPAPSDPAVAETDLKDKPPFYRFPALNASQRDNILKQHQQRLRSLASVDEAVAAIVDKLDGLGVLENTYVVFTSDNGFKLGEHQLGLGKLTDFEPDIHVPAMVRGPGIAAGTHTALLAGNVDWSPTFAAIAGAVPDRPQDGRSLLPILGPGAPPATWRTALLTAHKHGPPPIAGSDARIDLQEVGPSSAIPRFNPPDFYGLRSDRYLLSRFSTGHVQLYDLQRDPWELANLHQNPPTAFEQALVGRARQLRACEGSACVRLENAPLPATP